MNAIMATVTVTAAVACFYSWQKLKGERAVLAAERSALKVEQAKLRERRDGTIAPSAPSALVAAHQPRSWKSHLKGLDKMISELLCEARLLASELNKGGNPMAIVQDPLAPTVTAERRFGSFQEPPAPTRASSDSSMLTMPPRPMLQRSSTAMGTALNLVNLKTLKNFEPGKLQTRVVGVCGMSCSGKSTVTATLRSYAQSNGSYVPVICLDDSYGDWMDVPPSRSQRTNHTPVPSSARAWKNWESGACIDWQHFLDKLQAKIEIHKGYTPLIIIEGFLLLEDGAAAGLCDHVIAIDIPREIAWQRRLARAVHMANGEKDSSGMENYERLDVYALQDDYDEILKAAKAAVAREGHRRVFPPAEAAVTGVDLSGAADEYSWLWLYFEEVIWPEACAVKEHVHALQRSGRLEVSTVSGEEAPAEVEQATRKIIQKALVGRK